MILEINTVQQKGEILEQGFALVLIGPDCSVMGGLKLIIKTIVGSLIAGVIYTIIMGIYFKKIGISSSRKYISGIVFTVIFFVLSLILNNFF